MLIAHKADVNLHNDSGWTALGFAVGGCLVGTAGEEGIDIVKELIAAGADVNAKAGGAHGTLLSYALEYSNEDAKEVVKILKNHGASTGASK